MENVELGGDNYLTTPTVVKVLGVSEDVLSSIVEHGISRPARDPMRNGRILWDPESIFRAFVGIRMAHDFKVKYGKIDYDEHMYGEVARDIMMELRKNRREIIMSDEWKGVVAKASEKGLNLLNL